MARRKRRWRKKSDKKYFKNSATRAKKINISPKYTRGGIRL